VDNPVFTQLLAELPKPVGIFAYNDVTAAKVLSVLHAMGISVPEQAAVVGVDNDTDICENTHPPLSSVALDFESAGRLAVEILAAALDGRRRVPHRIFGVLGVTERGSTQSGRTGSRMILAVRDILRREYGEKLSLGSIARRLNVSPRLLTMRFREITGHSVHGELQEIRLSAAHKMLMSRTRPVKEIAAACGFPTLENFYRRYRLLTLVRLLQETGAYGFRGLIERKQLFLDCIPTVLGCFRELTAEPFERYPYLTETLQRLANDWDGRTILPGMEVAL
jgi:LacI family transcriptional regulator